MSPESDPAHRNVHQAVQEHYTATARAHLQVLDIPSAASGAACCGGGGCCGSSPAGSTTDDPITRNLYDPHTPFEAALSASLGCGNPTALAALEPGQVVLDLGSGGGLDVLLSARRVAPDGHAYGLDMTDDMLALARRNQAEAGVTNATFLKGHIEHVPLPDASVDVVISNCVINLAHENPLPRHPKLGPQRHRSDTMGDTLEASTQRLRHHLRRPHAGRRRPLK